MKKDLGIVGFTYFQYKRFCEWLARDRACISATYYVGKIRAKEDDNKGQQLRKSQQKVFAHLLSEGVDVETGYMMKHGNTFHEKGVDVKIAVDLLVGAYEDEFDTAILVSSDTDLIPAIKKVKELRKRVEYIGFAHAPSFGLQKHATISRLLIREEVEVFRAVK